MKRCQRCGSENLDDDKTCGVCKASLDPETNSESNQEPPEEETLSDDILSPRMSILLTGIVLLFLSIVAMWFAGVHFDDPPVFCTSPGSNRYGSPIPGTACIGLFSAIVLLAAIIMFVLGLGFVAGVIGSASGSRRYPAD